MKIVLETDRLVLRQVIPADDEFLLVLMNEPAFHQNIGDRGIRTLADARAYIEKRFTSRYAELGYGLYLVESKAEQTAMGISGFVKRDFLPHPDIGFAFLQKFRARGYGFESGAAVMKYGTTALGFEQIYGVTAPANTGSIRLLEKLGLHFEKQFRMPEHQHDSLLFVTGGKSPEQLPGTTDRR
jgi:RimJ/RimL family protein N-acetyltransferase